jgi:hypothetical protein
MTVSAKAAALGGVGPRHARRPEAADRWSSGHALRWPLVTGRALADPMKHRSFPHGHGWAGRARWPQAEDGRGGPRQDSRRRLFSAWSLVNRDRECQAETPPRQPSPGSSGEKLLEPFARTS